MLKVIVTTAITIDKRAAEKFKAAVVKKHGRETDFVFRVDPSVIGGVKVVLGSKAIDATVAGKLSQVKQQLLTKI